MWRLCVKNEKCMTTLPRLKYMQLICAGGCAIYKLQQNWCIRRSCTPTTTYEAHAVINKSDHLKTLSIILPKYRKKSVLRGDCERNPRSVPYKEVHGMFKYEYGYYVSEKKEKPREQGTGISQDTS
ncbi:hypothetical protein EVAR_87588_1 [Eumeta japonica]|uniref:Uncharacterized protein n=1 Tax=Eumeta variegata TaxID=151549 RepID=A0A4C1WMF1_EUMVA|nr:hypothetical protein EVAR_87588_1 [Eumeta japonica]